MSSVLQRLLHNLNLHSLLSSPWDSMAVVVGLGWCMTVFAPPPAEASEIVQQGALDYSEFSQGVG